MYPIEYILYPIYLFLYYTSIRCPMWFIALLHGRESSLMLYRHKRVQESYNKHDCSSFVSSLFSVNDESLFTMTLNHFPYHVDQRLDHYLLWVNPKYKFNYKILELAIKKYIRTHFLRDLDFYFYENIDKNKSIKSIQHLHVFIVYNID